MQNVVRLHLAGANPHPQVVGLDRLPGVSNYFIGRDQRHWRTNVPAYARVAYRNIYLGVDLVYYGNQGRLEYDLVIAPGATPQTIRLAVAGARHMQIDGAGNIALRLAAGDLRQIKPMIYQQVNGARHVITGHYVALVDHTIGFQIGFYDRHRPLIIDPSLVYSTYLGGSGDDVGTSIAVDAAGAAYVTGSTYSSDFPTTPGAFSSTHAEAFVTKLSASGAALVYSTYFGGSGGDRANGIAVDGTGATYITGETFSTDLPTRNALQPGYGGAESYPCTDEGNGSHHGDAFVAKLSPAGDALIYSTYLGGSGGDEGQGIAVDGGDNAYVTGSTNGKLVNGTPATDNFPTTPSALQTAFGGDGGLITTNHKTGECGPGDAFVSKLNPTGNSLIYSTYLGGSGADDGTGIAVDGSGDAYVTGATLSNNFPTTPGTLRPSKIGGENAFVSKLNPTGTALVYSTYLGGGFIDFGSGIAVDGSGDAYVTGATLSNNFPTTPGAPQAVFDGFYWDAFVSKLNPMGSALIYSTYLGGEHNDMGSGIAVDESGGAYVTGYTESPDFPTQNAPQPSWDNAACPPVDPHDYCGIPDAFVTKLDPVGDALVYSTYFGGSGHDVGTSIAVDGAGAAYITGVTTSTDFPMRNPLQPSLGGLIFRDADAFVSKIGASTPPAPSSIYALADLGTLSGSTSAAAGINNRGQVVGYAKTSGGDTHAFRTGANKAINPATDDLGTLGGTNSEATGINALGQVVGTSATASGTSHAFRTGANTAISAATDDLGTLGGTSSAATGINDTGEVVGYANTKGGLTHAFRTGTDQAINAATDDLGTLGDTTSRAAGINASGQVVGFATTSGGMPHAFRTGANAAIAPATDDVGTLGGTSSTAAGINASGQVAGSADTADGHTHAFYSSPAWQAVSLTDLAPLADLHSTSTADGINSSGEVVGYEMVTDAETGQLIKHAFIYSQASGLLDLNGLIPADSGWVLEEATGINDGGQIVGYSLHNGQQRAFRLDRSLYGPLPTATPIPSPTPTLTPSPTPVPDEPSLSSTPSSLPADGGTAALVTLQNAPAGDRVRFISSRDSLDTFRPTTGVIGAGGGLVSSLTSSQPGTALVTAQDLETGQTFATSARVVFTTAGQGGGPTTSAVAIVAVNARVPLNGRYISDVSTPEQIDTTVDWAGTTPGYVDFVLDGAHHHVVADAPGASYTLDLGHDLRRLCPRARVCEVARRGDAMR